MPLMSKVLPGGGLLAGALGAAGKKKKKK